MVLSMIFGTQLLTENSNRVDGCCLFVDLSCKGLPRSFKVDNIESCSVWSFQYLKHLKQRLKIHMS